MDNCPCVRSGDRERHEDGLRKAIQEMLLVETWSRLVVRLTIHLVEEGLLLEEELETIPAI